MQLEPESIQPNPWNSNFLGKDDFEALKKQMKISGLENTPPIIVRRKGKGYEIIDGEQRWKIARELSWRRINAVLISADDLKAKRLCISYNRWRGRLNWFKLHDIMVEDAETGVNVYNIYEGALSQEEIKEILSLGNLIPEAKKLLRQALEKHKETMLEHLCLISQFPRDRQDDIAKRYLESPYSTIALGQALEESWGQKPVEPGEEAPEETKKTEKVKKMQGKLPKGTTPQAETKPPRQKPPETPISVVSTEYRCPCGRRYQITWGKQWIMTLEMEGEKTETSKHVLSERRHPYEVAVKCPKCDRINKYFVEGQKTMKKTCWGCNLRGVLDIEARKAKWKRFR